MTNSVQAEFDEQARVNMERRVRELEEQYEDVSASASSYQADRDRLRGLVDAGLAREAALEEQHKAFELRQRQDAREYDELEAQFKTLHEVAERVALAHQRIIEGVTPNHPNATFGDEEAREAAWSEWHASCRALRVLLAKSTPVRES